MLTVRLTLPEGQRATRKLRRDVRTLVKFIELYCRTKHRGVPTDVVQWGGPGLAGILEGTARLCPDCGKLLAYALVKRVHCPLDPKPACKHCPSHCYRPRQRQAMRAVMAHSGRRLVLRGRLDYLWHLWS
jgi:hypothetical protein